MPSIRKSAEVSSRWAAIAIGLSVPISVALDNALLLLRAVLWLAAGDLQQKFRTIAKCRVALAALALIGLLAIGMLYGQASSREALDAFGKYIDLLFIPIFITLFRDEQTRRLALGSFVFAMVTTLALSYALKFGMLHQGGILRGFPGNPYVFKLHITQNFFMAYCAMVLATQSILAVNPKSRAIFGMLATLATINVLFMVQGRTGYIVIATYLIYLFVSKYGKRGLLIGAAAVILLGSIAYTLSSEFHERVSLAASEFKGWHPGHAAKESNSIGERMEFYSNTLKIVGQHPFFGVGTGGFEKAYAQEVLGTKQAPTHNPHNEFLLIASQLGLAGLVLLLVLFYVQWIEAGKLPPLEGHLAHGLVLAMAAGCMFNSFLLDHAEGLFFSWMTGVLFSARRTA